MAKTLTESIHVGGQIRPRRGNECDHVQAQQRDVVTLRECHVAPEIKTLIGKS